ncbi:MAG: NAD(P)/FAD-dependent oxidoreductase [Caldilineaceae bacterium]
MKIAVVGAGPAGLTAAYRLQKAGHRVEVLEASSVIGGRTHSARFGPGHLCDTGAGWLATFYTSTLLLFDELGYRDRFVRPRTVRGAADLILNGNFYPWSYRGDKVEPAALLDAEDIARYQAYLTHLEQVQPDHLEPDLLYDQRSGEDELAVISPNILNYVLRILFEGPWFTRLSTLSATHIRLWLRAVQHSHFFQLDDGMDAPWLQLAELLNVRTDELVEGLTAGAQQVTLHCGSGSRHYDGVVLAVPAPAATRIMATHPELAPTWLPEVEYASQVRIYAARRCADDARFGVHLLPPQDLFSVEFYSGRHGAWGACPDDWQWGLACTYGATCAHLLQEDRQQVINKLWTQARAIAPDLFTLAEADVVHYIGWEWAVPIMAPGHYGRLAAYRNRPPVAFAGDWMNEACVEGAVRSGEVAAAVFGAG